MSCRNTGYRHNHEPQQRENDRFPANPVRDRSIEQRRYAISGYLIRLGALEAFHTANGGSQNSLVSGPLTINYPGTFTDVG